MGIYTGLDEAALIAKADELRGKMETLATGGGVVRVAGEGRMIEYSRANAAGLQRLLNEVLAELAILRGEGDPRHAIGVVFP